MFIFKLIVSILVLIISFLLIFNYSTDEKPYTTTESLVILNVSIILLLAIVCIWI